MEPRNSLRHVFLSVMSDGSNPFDLTAYQNTHELSLVSLENILDSETNYVRPSCRVTSLKLSQLLLGPNILHKH